MLIKILGAFLIGMYLGNHGIIAFDVFTKKVNWVSIVIICGIIYIWYMLCELVGI